MDARLLDVLHDAGHEHGLAIGEQVHVDLDRVVQIAIDQDRPELGELRGCGHKLAELGGVVHDPYGPAAEHVRGADH